MSICVNCGVELDEGVKICPLCGKDPEEKIEQDNVSGNYPSEIIQLKKKENRKYFRELSGLIAISGIAACTIIDLLISNGLKWSLLSDISILSAWIILTLYQFAYKRPVLVIISLMLTTLAALFFIDLIITGRAWYFAVGLPVTITVFISIGILIFLYRKVHMRGLNLIAMGFIVLAGFCIVAEIVLDRFQEASVDLLWSLIVSVSILPVAIVLLFYHYRLKKGKRLDSFFHI
jgi:hypothetical protein